MLMNKDDIYYKFNINKQSYTAIITYNNELIKSKILDKDGTTVYYLKEVNFNHGIDMSRIIRECKQVVRQGYQI